VDYGQLLREHKLRQTGVEISYDELRRDSASVISPQDVAAVDEWLIGQLPTWRTEGNIVIDSHPVTKEVFGFRITPFSLDQVHRIGFDAILVLVGEPNTLAQRIAEDPHGRPNVDAFQSGFQVQLQAAVAVIYAIVCGRPCFAIDTTRSTAEDVAGIALDLLRKVGVPFEDIDAAAQPIS
jgi:adenylate kinase